MFFDTQIRPGVRFPIPNDPSNVRSGDQVVALKTDVRTSKRKNDFRFLYDRLGGNTWVESKDIDHTPVAGSRLR